jgi:hypothetical protein
MVGPVSLRPGPVSLRLLEIEKLSAVFSANRGNSTPIWIAISDPLPLTSALLYPYAKDTVSSVPRIYPKLVSETRIVDVN